MSKNVVRATLRVIDHDIAGPPRPDDLAKLAAPLTSMLAAELDEAQRYLRIPTAELLIAALARTIGRTIGSGELSVDVLGVGPVPLGYATSRKASATKVLRAVHHTLSAISPTSPPADMLFSYVGGAAPAAYEQALPSRGHAVELRVYRSAGELQMDWWYDARRLDAATVEELTEQFPLALIELTSEALPLEELAEAQGLADMFALADS
jgi:hypothetical protein